MTFKAWIKGFKDENSPIGDLANDIAIDESFPDSTSYENTLEYLESLDACDGAIKAFKSAWKLYEQQKP